MKSNPAKRAFTLIELLVVISIISLLVSILLPSLSKAKGLARTVVCQTNLRSIGTAEMFYTQDHAGQLAWTRLMRPEGAYMYWAGYLWQNSTGSVPTNLEDDPPVTEPGIYHCPAQPEDEGWSDVPRSSPRPYWLQNLSYTRNSFQTNSYLWATDAEDLETIKGRKLHDIQRPSETADVADGFYQHFVGAFGPSHYNNLDDEGQRTDYRHGDNDTLNLLLWDSHVENATSVISVEQDQADPFITFPEGW